MSESDMDARDVEMDGLLRQSMAAPIPRLSPDFHQNLSRELRHQSRSPNQSSSQFGRMLLAGYGGISVVTSMVVMRGQGLGWAAIAVMILAPLPLLELSRRLVRRRFRIAAW
ncbi:MAG: hypothetical protein WBS24_07795 [Terriglobales bacterium]